MQTPTESVLPMRSVLYIEDNAANIALVEQLIARRGDLNFMSVRNGHQGIKMACAHLPDVILMDIQLPDMSGIDALKRLRDIPATAHIPVMALSSDAFPRQIEKGIDTGFCQYITKPFRISAFMEALDASLSLAAQQAHLANRVQG